MPRMDSFAEPGCGVRAAEKFITLKALWLLMRDALFQWIDDNPFRLAAALAYYTLFSMAPLLLIAVAVAGVVFGREASQNQIISAIGDLVGVESARAIQVIIERRRKAGLRVFSLYYRHDFLVARGRRRSRTASRLA